MAGGAHLSEANPTDAQLNGAILIEARLDSEKPASRRADAMAGILILAITFGSTNTGTGLADDRNYGMISRSAPCSWPAPHSWPVAHWPTRSGTPSWSA